MRGHEPLLAMRRAGAVPSAVWLSLDDDVSWRDWPQNLGLRWRKHPDYFGSAHVRIDTTDSIELLDLRYLVGLQAWVEGYDAPRVERLHAACAAAGAARVLTAVHAMGPKGEPVTVAMYDSDGVLEWAQ